MKNYLLKTLAVVITAFVLLTIQSCDPDPCSDIDCGPNATCFDGICIDDDPCADIDCGPNGTCFDGDCECEPGYDGNSCEIIIRSLFTGTFDAAEVCTIYEDPDNYVSVITESFEGPEYIVIDNMYNFSNVMGFNIQPEEAAVLASVSNVGGEYTVLIEKQGFTSGALPNYEIIGGGVYDPATAQITLDYSITDLDEEPGSEYYSDYCTVVYSPR